MLSLCSSSARRNTVQCMHIYIYICVYGIFHPYVVGSRQ